jgi:cytoskeleton protein RodZ
MPAESATATATEQAPAEPATQSVQLPELVTEPVAVVTEPPAEVSAAPVTGESEPAGIDSEATAGQGRLIITYSKDSWTDIRDASGEKLLYRTVKAGQTVALAGQVPLSLFFGFAQGVKVNFNGRDVDLAPYTRGVFARLTLGESNR